MSTLRTILDPTINFSLRERVNRMGELATRTIAHRLPYKIKYWTYISFATEHMKDDDIVPEVRMMDILQRAKN